MASQRARRGFRLLLAGIAAAAVLLPIAVTSADRSEAAVAANFDPGYLISDATFFNGAAMSTAQVQSFLTQRTPSCAGANGQPCLSGYRMSTPSRAANAYCGAISGVANESAASIIARVGAACSINPQVLLVTLQKERGLVTKTSPTATDYRIAMGYACPDTAPCDTQYYGFFNQVYSAAQQFQRYTKNPGDWNYQAGRNNAIQYHPNAACGTKTVYIRNQATANLYIYTPYVPNAAALGNLYGTGDGCSSYGNRNFWVWFTDWFGSPANWLQSPSFEGGSIYGWGASNGFINQAVVRDARARDGAWFAATNTAVAGRALSQDVRRTVNVGETVTASVWLRSADARPFTAKVALWGLGGTTELAQKQVVVTTTWTQVIVKLPVRLSSHTTVRLDLYLGTTNGTLWVDGAELGSGATPPPRNQLSSPSFEGTMAGWGPGNGFVNRAVYNSPTQARDGSWFAAANTAVGGRSLAQNVKLPTAGTGQYVFSVWLRSSNSTPMTGSIALWGLGGARTVGASSSYTVTGTWTRVDVVLDTGTARPSTLRAEVYFGTGASLWLDGAVLAKQRLTAGSFENGDFTGWVRSGTEVNVSIQRGSTSDPAADGAFFLATNTSNASRSLYQDAPVTTTVGDSYRASIWVKAPAGYAGSFALWALGGAGNEVVSLPFSGTGAWQRLEVTLPIRIENHTSLRLEVYQQTVGVNLRLDGARVY